MDPSMKVALLEAKQTLINIKYMHADYLKGRDTWDENLKYEVNIALESIEEAEKIDMARENASLLYQALLSITDGAIPITDEAPDPAMNLRSEIEAGPLRYAKMVLALIDEGITK